MRDFTSLDPTWVAAPPIRLVLSEPHCVCLLNIASNVCDKVLLFFYRLIISSNELMKKCIVIDLSYGLLLIEAIIISLVIASFLLNYKIIL